MSSVASPSRWNPWPIALIAFFTLAILSIAGFVVFCTMHPEELVAPDYYEQEIRYQGHLEKMARARELKGRLSLRYDRATKVIQVGMPAEAFGPSAAGHIDLYRPSSRLQDLVIKLNPSQGANQTIDASKLSPGLWRVRVSWSNAGQEYWAEEKVILETLSSTLNPNRLPPLPRAATVSVGQGPPLPPITNNKSSILDSKSRPRLNPGLPG